MGFYSNLDIELQQAVREIKEQNDDTYLRELCAKYPSIVKYDEWAGVSK